VGRREHREMLSQFWHAVRVGVWLLGLPIRLRRRSLPRLLDRLTVVQGQPSSSSLQETWSMVSNGLNFPHIYPLLLRSRP
jgi:hypothetical protein